MEADIDSALRKGPGNYLESEGSVVPLPSRRSMEANYHFRYPQATCFPPRQPTNICRNYPPAFSHNLSPRPHAYNLNGFPPLFDPAIVNDPQNMHFPDYLAEPYAYPVNSLSPLPLINSPVTPLSDNLHLLVSSLLLSALIGLSTNSPQRPNEPETDDGIRVIIRPFLKGTDQQQGGETVPSSGVLPYATQLSTNSS
ncbi:hypothetical protein ECG_03094 [Echinococcus granulosus]|nr:hypothetical protein ECG_03094 [Echinococcus granulosus]